MRSCVTWQLLSFGNNTPIYSRAALSLMQTHPVPFCKESVQKL